MSIRVDYRDQYGHVYSDDEGTTASSSRLSHQNYSSSARSSDYISQTSYSSSDYISKPSQPNHTAHSTKRSRSSRYDYIGRPAKSKSDYISPLSSRSNSYPSGRLKSSYDERHSTSSSNAHESTRYPTMLRSQDRKSPDRFGDKSNYQVIKEGSWDNRFDFMRSHGLKTWEQDDFDVANSILDKYREVDAHSARRNDGKPSSRVERYSGSDVESYGRISDYDEDDDNEVLAGGSDIASYRETPQSSRASRRSSVAYSNGGSDICSLRSGRRSSVPYNNSSASEDEDGASDIVRDGSDYASDIEHGLGEGSDYAFHDHDNRSDVVSCGVSDVASGRDSGIGDTCSDGIYDDDYMDERPSDLEADSEDDDD